MLRRSTQAIASETYDEASVTYSGFIKKRGQRHKTWYRRWMIMTRDGKLRYYKLKEKPAQGGKMPTPQGHIDVSQCCLRILDVSDCDCTWPPDSTSETAFAIQTTHRTYYMYTETATMAKVWKSEIAKASCIMQERAMEEKKEMQRKTEAALKTDPRLEQYRSKIEHGESVPILAGSRPASVALDHAPKPSGTIEDCSLSYAHVELKREEEVPKKGKYAELDLTEGVFQPPPRDEKPVLQPRGVMKDECFGGRCAYADVVLPGAQEYDAAKKEAEERLKRKKKEEAASQYATVLVNGGSEWVQSSDSEDSDAEVAL